MKKTATKTETPAIVNVINPPKGKTAKTAITSKPVIKPKSGVVTPPSLTADQEKELSRLLAIRNASRTTVGTPRWGNSIIRTKGSEESYNRLPPQAKIILKVMDDAKKTKMTFNELTEAMAKVWPRDRYRQEPARIVQFYRTRLLEGGHAKFE